MTRLPSSATLTAYAHDAAGRPHTPHGMDAPGNGMLSIVPRGTSSKSLIRSYRSIMAPASGSKDKPTSSGW